MSTPMEVSLPNGSEIARPEAVSQPLAAACSAPVDDKILVSGSNSLLI
jgi:hypothetical protein